VAPQHSREEDIHSGDHADPRGIAVDLDVSQHVSPSAKSTHLAVMAYSKADHLLVLTERKNIQNNLFGPEIPTKRPSARCANVHHRCERTYCGELLLTKKHFPAPKGCVIGPGV
jgi:hypothetical protein